MAGTSAKFEVLLTEGAEQDLEAIHDYIAEHDSLARANHVLDQVEKVVESLSRFPERGSYPKELVSLGIKEYRQTFFKPYRVIYRVLKPLPSIRVPILIDETPTSPRHPTDNLVLIQSHPRPPWTRTLPHQPCVAA